MADRDTVKRSGRTDTYEQTFGVAAKIGGTMQTPHGEIDVVDAPGLSSLLVVHPTDPSQSRIGLLLYDPEIRTGMIGQLDADTARTFAASFLRLADQLEPRKAN